jgi:hypothetical protein
MDFYSALALGLIGSLHCAGMCGPIALALPLGKSSWLSRVTGGVVYNTGRTITYAILGAVLGLAGMGLALGGLQQWTSIVLGALMILAVIVPRLGKAGAALSHRAEKLSSFFTRPLAGLFRVSSFKSLFLIGILNGFLPCGLVYIALAGAVVTGHATDGAVYMAAFGLGTIPMLLAISLAGNFLTRRFRSRLAVIIPVFIAILGILFILRGLNLGIPYVSPKLSQQEGKATMECCHPKK